MTVYLNPIVPQSTERAKSETPESASEAEKVVNPNIETTYKPFNEKLALFRKVDMEDEVVTVDPEKCKYATWSRKPISCLHFGFFL